ncbi:MAG TPA: RNA polymerase sigma factor [Candidatus Gracilibacteria bacterium]|nr:RNA polymerase sigma factor [Candidatus Gracilibacteria bacterium]HRY91734.1 RNA polymerase sigma factor [Candidatus Gracilibacteria bacterium]
MNATQEKKDFAQMSDLELVQQTLKDQQAFYWIMKRYETRLMHFIKRISNVDYHTAEDILQEVYIKIFKNLNGFDQKMKFSSWIYRIAHNETISHYRKMKARAETVSLENDDAKGLIAILSDSFDFKAELNSKLVAEKVQKIIYSMPQKYNEVLILRYMEEKDYDEIADILKKPSGTVATLINRAKEYFKNAAKKQNLTNLM